MTALTCEHACVRVLVCEDDGDVADLIEAVLLRQGHDVLVVGTVGEAVGAIEGGAFEVVVTDLGLPDASGVAVCEAATAAGARVVVVTANARLGDLPVVRRHTDYVLTKPFPFDALLEAVDAA